MLGVVVLAVVMVMMSDGLMIGRVLLVAMLSSCRLLLDVVLLMVLVRVPS